jgi:hypothetical protein
MSEQSECAGVAVQDSTPQIADAVHKLNNGLTAKLTLPDEAVSCYVRWVTDQGEVSIYATWRKDHLCDEILPGGTLTMDRGDHKGAAELAYKDMENNYRMYASTLGAGLRHGLT